MPSYQNSAPIYYYHPDHWGIVGRAEARVARRFSAAVSTIATSVPKAKKKKKEAKKKKNTADDAVFKKRFKHDERIIRTLLCSDKMFTLFARLYEPVKRCRQREARRQHQ